MMLQPFKKAEEHRRGMILMVVLILLTLFAIVGLSFALYASSEAEASRLYRDAQVAPVPDLDPEALLTYFLGQLLYDVDDSTGVYSAMRGHSLARTMYGYNYPRAVGDPTFLPNTVPFNGPGRLHSQPGLTPTNPFGMDDYNLINYTFFQQDGGFLRDPERGTSQPGVPGPFIGGFNAPYTYPDLNNMFLAAVRADGTVLAPSFHRPYTGFGVLDPSNPNWTDTTKPWLKYMVLRPGPRIWVPVFLSPTLRGGAMSRIS